MVRAEIFLTALFASIVPNFCQTIPGECQNNDSTVYRYEVLPGSGWDNLRNENRGRVVQFTYSTCRTTEDGVFLVPDNVNVIPIRSSNVDRYSQFIEHVENATSDIAVSINLDGSVAVDDIPINGKFSFDFQKFKSNMINDNSIAMKVKAHYVQYNAKLQPDVNLDPSFKSKVMSIANHILNNRTSSARYESQLLVRDFGTHVITSIDSGASIVKVDHVKRELLQDDTIDKFQISAAAGSELFGVQVGITIPAEVMTKYLASKTHSSILTHGGPLYLPVNFTINDWVNQIDKNLVSVDRSGDPLHFIINEYVFPELSISIVTDTAAAVESAIKTYYKLNTHRGCTDRDSPNYNYLANVDDGTCEYNLTITNTNFGGVFQTCNTTGNIHGICDTFLSKNPMTGDFSCPTGFVAVPLYLGQENKQEVHRTCSKYMIFWKHCETTSNLGTASYQSYWCSPQEGNQRFSGYLFGGLYTTQLPNVVTQHQSCPQYFTAIGLAEDLKICVSDDIENGFQYSIPFDGFFSCQNDNSLAVNQNATHCQAGYSEHLATIVNECEINYCATQKSSATAFIPIRSPPFMRKPSGQNISSIHVISEDGQSWTQIYSVPVGFTGFNGTNTSWIVNSGDFLDNNELLMARQKANGDTPDKNSGLFGSTDTEEKHGKQNNAEQISTEQILGVVGGSVGITFSFVIFIGFFVYVISRKRVPKADAYTKLKA
ncbi:macrophage-expressed gene 1 protein-like [Mytilus edulis]|uniref:macrophage-expressed gene 1 protein-like n=1 Tax=Mytilus edulis TaxID=6550 RepID=UPI0039EF4558